MTWLLVSGVAVAVVAIGLGLRALCQAIDLGEVSNDTRAQLDDADLRDNNDFP